MLKYTGSGKFAGKVALVTGGDSGIGRAVAMAFAKDGAVAAIVYLAERGDARDTEDKIKRTGRSCLPSPADVGDKQQCLAAVSATVARFGRLDLLVNNAAEQHPRGSIEEITVAQLDSTFRSNLSPCST